MGRRSKLTKELISEAEKLIKLGNYNSTVCDYLGIHESTWYRWLKEGEEAKRGIKKEFYETIKKAEAHAEIRNVQVIQTASQDNWQASAWYLERKFPDRWGRKDRLQAELNHSGQIDIRAKLASMSDEELERIAEGFEIDE